MEQVLSPLEDRCCRNTKWREKEQAKETWAGKGDKMDRKMAKAGHGGCNRSYLRGPDMRFSTSSTDSTSVVLNLSSAVTLQYSSLCYGDL